MNYKIFETVSRFSENSCNYLLELFENMNPKPIIFSEFSNLNESYGNLVCISHKEKVNRFQRMLIELKYYNLLNKDIKKSEEKVIIIHSHWGPKGYYDNKFVNKRYKGKDIKQIISFYGYDLSQLLGTKWDMRYVELSRNIDRFLVLGETMKRKLCALGIEPHKVQVFHLGVDISKINYIEKEGIKNKTVTFILVGRFTEKKGIPLAIKAFNKYYIENSNSRLIIVGDSGSSPENELEKEKIMNVFKSSTCKEAIEFKGLLSYENLLLELSLADILLQPSIRAINGDEEGTPVSILNAMSFGIPIIGSNHSDIPEIVQHMKEGILFEQNNEDDLLNAMMCLTSDNQIYLNMSQNARHSIEYKFNIKVQSRKLSELYSDISKS